MALRDLARVPLFAEATEDRLELALVVGRNHARRTGLVRRVHAHVEGSIGCVREAALGAIDLHRREAEVEKHRVGAHAVAGELREDDAVVAAQEPRLHAASPGLHPVEVGTHRRVAIDRDELPASAQVRREQARVPPAPNVASTIVSPGCTSRSSRTSSARTGT